ncbi:MAG: signal peptidase I [Candidatus Caldarchaeales archaeon]
MGKIKKAFNIIVFATLIILLGLLLAAAISSLTGEVFPLLVVKSGSMEPVLRRGDIILIEKIDPDKIRADIINGDIIVFYKPGTNLLIVHRAIEKVEDGYITKGDANMGSDYFSPIPPENIVGRWTGFKIPYWSGLGYLSLFLRGELYPPYGRIVLIVLIAINVILIVRDVVLRVKKNVQEEKKVES